MTQPLYAKTHWKPVETFSMRSFCGVILQDVCKYFTHILYIPIEIIKLVHIKSFLFVSVWFEPYQKTVKAR